MLGDRLSRGAKEGKLVRTSKSLPIEQLLKVAELASPDEMKELRPILERSSQSLARSHSTEETPELQQRIGKLLASGRAGQVREFWASCIQGVLQYKAKYDNLMRPTCDPYTRITREQRRRRPPNPYELRLSTKKRPPVIFDSGRSEESHRVLPRETQRRHTLASNVGLRISEQDFRAFFYLSSFAHTDRNFGNTTSWELCFPLRIDYASISVVQPARSQRPGPVRLLRQGQFFCKVAHANNGDG